MIRLTIYCITPPLPSNSNNARAPIDLNQCYDEIASSSRDPQLTKWKKMTMCCPHRLLEVSTTYWEGRSRTSSSSVLVCRCSKWDVTLSPGGEMLWHPASSNTWLGQHGSTSLPPVPPLRANVSSQPVGMFTPHPAIDSFLKMPSVCSSAITTCGPPTSSTIEVNVVMCYAHVFTFSVLLLYELVWFFSLTLKNE